MKKFLIIFGLILSITTTAYATMFCCPPEKTPEECCAERGKMYCENDGKCRVRCVDVQETDCVGGCINPDGKCCTWCPTAEVCARMNKCQKIDENGCYTCAECDEECPAPKCLNQDGQCCPSCPRTCPEGMVLINKDGCYECGNNCEEGLVLMADGSCQGCVDGYNSYCNLVNDTGVETTETKACVGIGCTTSTSCVLTQNGNVQGCCSSGQTSYAKTTYEDGTPKDIACCTKGYEIAPVKISATENAPDGGVVNYCVSSGYTAYCSSYDENGKCTEVSTKSYACTPYVSGYDENGNPKSGSCGCGADATPYVEKTYDDGTPKEGYCCASGSTVQALTTDGTTKVPNGGYVNYCGSSGKTAYCSSYDENGKCTTATTTSGICTPYVRRTYDDGTPKEGYCCASGSTVQNLGTPNGGYVNVCALSGATDYCWKYDENGKCTSVASASYACTPYVYSTYDDGTPKTGNCCASGSTVQALTTDGTTPVANGGYMNYCVSSGYTAYCTSYDENGKCTSASSCSGTPYVSEYYENGNPKTRSCCSSSNKLTEFDGVYSKIYVCHSSSDTVWCTTYDENGKCMQVKTSSSACTPYVYEYYENGNPKNVICYVGTCTPYVSQYYENGKPKSGYCCSGTPYVSEYYENGNPKTGSCSSEVCTPYVSEYYENGNPKTGSCGCGIGATAYVESTYDDDTPKTGVCCENGYELQTIGGKKRCARDESCADGYSSYQTVSGKSCCNTSGSYYVSSVADGLEACCESGHNSYCSWMSDGVCMETKCCDILSSYKLKEFDATNGGKVGVCYYNHPSNTPYCQQYDENGKCMRAGYSSDCTLYVSSYYENGKPRYGSCCNTSYNTLTEFNGIGGKIGFCQSSSSTSTVYCSEYDENGKCTSVDICSGTVYESEYYENGKLKTEECRTTECTPYVSEYYENGNPKSGSCSSSVGCMPYVSETYDDGRTKGIACCASGKEVVPVKISATENAPDGGWVNYCVSSGYTAYCLIYNESGKCTTVGTSSSACTPYVSRYDEKGNPERGSCSSSVGCMPYVSGTYDDGTPKYGSCCSSGYKVVSIKISATENAPDGGYVNECVRSGYTAYCSEYDENEKCTSVNTSSSACTPYVSGIYDDGSRKSGGCCSGMPYVSEYDENGNLMSGNCCDTSSKTLTEFDGIGGKIGYCHSSSYTAYCKYYDENGKCTSVSTSSSACTPYVSEYDENGMPKNGSCGTAGCTPYVSDYYENGNPKTGGCSSSAGCTPYVRRTYDDGTPKEGYCCASGSTVQNLGTPNGGYVNYCVSSGYTAYCTSYDENGKCTSASSCSGTPYVRTTYEDGSMRAVGCCASGSTVQNLGTPNGGYVNECVSSGSTAYCSSYDENGKCMQVKTSSSACTPYVSQYYENGNPKTGGCSSSVGCTPYVSSYYENGNPKSGYYCDTSSKTLTEFDAPNGSKVGVCHNSFEFAYCSSYNADGKCIGATTSLVKDCKPYRKSATEGDCCAGTLETVEDSPYPVCSNRL